MREKSLLYGLVILCIIAFSFTRLNAQGSSNRGTDFWVPYAGHVDGTLSRLTLFLTSEYAANVRVRAKGFDVNVSLQPNEAKPVLINPEIYDVYIGAEDGIEKGKAIHVTSDKPIVVYSHISNRARSAACLVYPTAALGLNYFGISYVQQQDTQNEVRSSQFTIVGVEDGTDIEVTPTQDSRGNSSHTANKPFIITLNTGDVYQYQSKLDLSGSQFRTVNGCKPFSVFSGSSKNGFCEEGNTVSPDSPTGQDNLYQQLLPVSAWGKNFVSAPFYNALHGNVDIYRIQVAEDNTIVKVNGSTTSASGDMLNNPYKKGSIITFKSQTSNIIQADKPINVTQFQTSQNCNPFNRNGLVYPGDPEMTILNPIEQTLKDITLYSAVWTPETATNITSHYINIIIKTAFANTLTVDGGGFTANPDGAAFAVNKFIKINDEYSYIIVDVTQSSNINPTHRIKADGGFVAIAYGYGSVESYGYLAGSDLRNLNKFIQPENPTTQEPLLSGCVNTSANLFVSLPYKTSSLKWDLGNGTILTDPNPDAHYTLQTVNGETLYKYSYFNSTINYSQAGIYNIKVLAVNPNPIACTADETIELNYEVFALPVASFSTEEPYCKGAPIKFIDKSTGSGKSIKKWIWNFGDGTAPETRLTADPFTHTFTASGDYQVKLSIETETGCVSSAQYIQTVHVRELPVAKFLASKPNCENQEIKFTDQSTIAEGLINKWSWDFGDSSSGASNLSNLQHPAHTFSKIGVYSVKLTVETDKGCVNTLMTDITVSTIPVADFSTPDICITDAAAEFTNTSTIADGTQNALTYLWDFGDPGSGTRNTATTKNASHLYPRDGEFTVRLTVTSAAGCINVKEKKFVVNGLSPLPEFSANVSSFCSGEEVEFTESSTVSPGKIVRLEWYFDETNNAGNNAYKLTELRPNDVPGRKYTFKYPVTHNITPQLINIRLRAFSGTLCYADKVRQIQIKGMPEIEFSPKAEMCLNDEPVQLKAKEIHGFAVGSAVYTGKGVSSSGLFDPKLAGEGSHVITYSFTSAEGCSIEKSATINVSLNPDLDAGEDVTILKGGEIELNAKSATPKITYKWVPSEGLSSDTIPNPIASPVRNTTYTLTVTSQAGCTTTDEVEVKVKEDPDIPNAFSPNSDGTNDKWEIDYLQTWVNASILIFNRYGQMVFSSGKYTTPWDGTYRGKEVPVGVYYYVITPNNGRKKHKGSITLLR